MSATVTKASKTPTAVTVDVTAKRVQQGPTMVNLIFKPDTTPEFVAQVKDALTSANTSGQMLVRALDDGNAAPFLRVKLVRGENRPRTPKNV